ncbi:unnamed protein product [Commensalibacter communis]|uniref:Cyanophage baseplate Pam3 plug gp18 domain-containing protein n=1 Tax=Commensalibacter communis TaxID=2972786 RepID=A0A9W4TQA7_9PROT|nr:hypothetical protein [Commensalibacter communis]CAI3941514.1 unnamed protein product [Commensalibacter communis]CAI3945112.1 unnamed protein product [Commensalibacter communis]CAI3959271.1 unnamed protein product [Commensalibacter communis]CAI3960813.1 unnamed protein product [Commensalibacter communis]
MELIDIDAVDNQTFSLNLEGASYHFRLKDLGKAGVYLDVNRNGQPLIMGVLCLDRVRIIRSAYKDFPGDLLFVDQNGFTNPTYLGFGTRFLLYHVSKDEDGEVGL